MKYKINIRRVAGMFGVLVGIYMIFSLNNKLGVFLIPVGLAMLFWRYNGKGN